jgi:predicted dehydrogenase
MKNHPHFSRRSVLKLLGTSAASAPFVSSRLMAQSPANTVRHACFGLGGQGEYDLAHISNCKNVEIVAFCDVDLAKAAPARAKFPKARFYQDWREMLDKEAANIDSVSVSTPDHMHAPMGVSAMQLGKHLYGQKPLAHSLHEVRRMTEVAREKKVVTQMGIQMHSTAYYRMAAQVIQDGAIGKIKEVHTWSYKKWGDPTPKPDKNDPVPEGFDWNLWLGIRPERPFIGDKYYHPENWRKRLDFGTGTLGDMGCHILDPIFESLKLNAPVSVRSEGPAPNAWNWAIDGKVIYSFARTPMTEGDINVTWYDGASKPPKEVTALLEGKKRQMGQGTIFIGTEGVLLLPHVSRPELIFKEKSKDYKLPRVTGADHWEQFIEACCGNGETSAPFDYAGPLTEAILLGGIASRFPGTTLKWDSPGLKFDLAEANQFVRHEYREGWKIPGLG